MVVIEGNTLYVKFPENKKRTGNELDSLKQLFSPLACLTSVFGMGTGVTTPVSSPDLYISGLFPEN